MDCLWFLLRMRHRVGVQGEQGVQGEEMEEQGEQVEVQKGGVEEVEMSEKYSYCCPSDSGGEVLPPMEGGEAGGRGGDRDLGGECRGDQEKGGETESSGGGEVKEVQGEGDVGEMHEEEDVGNGAGQDSGGGVWVVEGVGLGSRVEVEASNRWGAA